MNIIQNDKIENFYVKYKGNMYALLSKIHIKTPTIKKDKI